jgi:acyl-CoA thioester hydrolase
VYWEDTDGGGVVYYANYLKFMERARTEWLRAAGFSQQALAAEQGIVFAVTRVEVDYLRPARLDDELIVTCEPRRTGAASLSFAQRVHRGAAIPAAGTGERPAGPGERPAGAGELLAEGAVQIACVDARTFRPQRLPQFLLDVLTEERA